MKILGIDLGTSNTYIYYTEENSTSQLIELPRPVIVPGVTDDTGSMATVVMYEDDKPVLIGNIAESEFYTNLEKQPRRRLASQFKPEISQATPAAMAAMTDFLALLKKELNLTLERDTLIYVGMPSLAREDFAINMRKCFQNADWPKPLFVRESDAALISCLQSGTLDADDLASKSLILDFGGGTCDFTTIENMDVLQNGGDNLYGGRLFDDLFYQAFCSQNEDFARELPASPYAWYVHWIECKKQKEKFSNAIDADANNEENKRMPALHAPWYDKKGMRHDAWINNYGKDDFIIDAENFRPSKELLDILESYQFRAETGKMAEALIDGKKIGLLSWLKDLLGQVSQPATVSKVIITGGSSRWFFVREIIERTFTHAICVPSKRSFEDIAFGLALYPELSSSRKKVQELLNKKIANFTAEAIKIAKKLMQNQMDNIVKLCSERIVERDVIPTLEEARKNTMTLGEMEKAFSDNIKKDSFLEEIVQTASENLSKKIQLELNFAFRNWLRENGVLLVPNFVFPTQTIGKEFFDDVNVKVSRLDSLNLMKFTVTKVLPLLAGTGTAAVMAHSGEPVSALLGGGLAFASLWFTAKAAPKFLDKRKMPSFLLTDANRRKIADKNREYIEEVLMKSLKEIETKILANIETRLGSVLEGMLARLGALNQVKIN